MCALQHGVVCSVHRKFNLHELCVRVLPVWYGHGNLLHVCCRLISYGHWRCNFVKLQQMHAWFICRIRRVELVLCLRGRHLPGELRGHILH